MSVDSLKRLAAKSSDAWGVYRTQTVFPAAVALALLYLTVMNFVSFLGYCPQCWLHLCRQDAALSMHFCHNATQIRPALLGIAG